MRLLIVTSTKRKYSAGNQTSKQRFTSTYADDGFFFLVTDKFTCLVTFYLLILLTWLMFLIISFPYLQKSWNYNTNYATFVLYIVSWTNLDSSKVKIWDALRNLVPFEKREKTHGCLFLLEKLPAQACNFIKNNTHPWVLFTFLK